MQIAIVLFDGFDNLDAIGPFEVFNHARSYGASLRVSLNTLEYREIVTSNHGLRIEPDGRLPREDDPDLVVVPGGGWSQRARAGSWAEVKRGDLPDALAEMHATGTGMASVCTGGMILAHAGITARRPAVTHHGALDDLRATDTEVIEARVVDDGDVVTAGGVTSGIDMALHLVAREFGEELADRVARQMEYEPTDDVYVS